jgi:hypothetical protein
MKKTIYSIFTICLFFLGTLNAQVVATFAGSGTAGNVNATGIAASFNNPTGVCFDYTTNDIIVADRTGHKIRRISPSGVVTTVAGSGSPGSANGTGTAASFNFPTGVCVDLSGNIYVADFGNNKIRHITPAGVVTTYAGSGAFGSAGGLATSATFSNPTGICTDFSNNFYVVDYSGHNIRKISSGGIVSVFAGSTTGLQGSTNAIGTAARFTNPWGICIDQAGDLYIADGGNNMIRKINTTTAAVTTLAGSGTAGSANGTGITAEFNFPTGVCADASGNIYVADDNKIRVINSASVVTTYAGTGVAGFVEGPAATAQFNVSQTLCLDASNNVYVADKNNNKIRKICAVAPNVTASASNTVVCLNSSITLNGSGADSYAWYNGITNNVAFTPTATGISNFTVVGTNTTTGCSNVSVITVSVSPSPTVSVSGGTICPGNSFTISPTGATSYTYSSASAIVSPTATAVYSVTGSNGSCTQTKTLSVIVNSQPTITAPASTTLCSGNFYQFSATGATSYTITDGTTPIYATTSNTFFPVTNSITPTSSVTYTITGNISGGCVSNPVVSNITVNTTPTIAVSSGTICRNQSFTISPTGAISYTYSGGSAIVSPTTTTVYNVTGANGNCSSSKNVTVTVNPNPNTIVFLQPNAVFCPGAVTEMGYANPSLSVTVNGVLSTEDGFGKYTYSATTTQTLNYVYTNTLTGCSTVQAPIVYNVLSNTITISSSAANPICAGQSAVLTASVAGTLANLAWSNASVFGNTTTVSPTVTTTYTIAGQDQGGYGCNYSATYTQSVTTCTGIDEVINNNLFSIYPNPANDILNVELGDVNENSTIQIINALGEVVLSEVVLSNSTTLKTNNLTSGVYFIKVESKNGSAIKKFIKQ